ncbi:hypothetical protein [Actinoallomurus vinaceus]|uniref:hypothetical protein n=1 Tax=Actinoallomurus vinaceus TaxID=1080074 RepID=UPI0031EBEA20
MAVRNGKVFGQTVNEATSPPTPTPLTNFTSSFGAVTVACAAVSIQGNANVFVTIRTDTNQLLEVGCTLNNFPTSCGGTVVNLGVIPMGVQEQADFLRRLKARLAAIPGPVKPPSVGHRGAQGDKHPTVDQRAAPKKDGHHPYRPHR